MMSKSVMRIGKWAIAWLGLCMAYPPNVALSADPVATTVEKYVEDSLPPTAMERVDGMFAKAVSVAEKVLFHRLFLTQREYVTYSHREVYVRDRGTMGPFVHLGGTGSGPQELSDREIRFMAARGDLLEGQTIDGQPRQYRWGQVGDRSVEAIIVRVPQEFAGQQLRDGDKFVKSTLAGKTVFAKVGPMRGLLDYEKVLSPEQVAELGQKGVLAGGATGIEVESVGGIPMIVLWLGVGGVIATFYLGFVNFWGFYHAIECVGGKYDDPNEPGEVNHFQALASALSGTVGLGNIAGVTIAMSMGGPGAFLWMMLSAFFGMTLKCVECTLGVKYRQVHPDGSVLGGPMRYLALGLKNKGLGGLGSVLAVLFTILCIFGSFGGGNMLQVNQSGAAMLQMLQMGDLETRGQLNEKIRNAAEKEDDVALKTALEERQIVDKELRDLESTFKPLYGVVMAALVAVVIIGGIKRIGKAAEIMVPGMCLVYITACLYIILRHFDQVPAMISLVVSEAFAPRAIEGGILGVLVIGVQRAVFSNEAGAGSSPIAHSAARTDEPIREGMVALLEPFIDTLIVCSMTALAMLLSGAWNNSEWIVDQELRGAALTSRAFQSEVSWFPYVLAVSVTLFAFSTIISWAYYGERCWETLFGRRLTPVYKILAVCAVFVGAVVNLGSVLDFSDMMILGMAFPNILGLYFLLGEVRSDLLTYWKKYKTGEFNATHQTDSSEIA
jgi:AGCS family alanine or glycine:cation symporter